MVAHDSSPTHFFIHDQIQNLASCVLILFLCINVFAFRGLQQFEAFHDGEVIKLHQFEIMQVANLMQADSEVDEVR